MKFSTWKNLIITEAYIGKATFIWGIDGLHNEGFYYEIPTDLLKKKIKTLL